MPDSQKVNIELGESQRVSSVAHSTVFELGGHAYLISFPGCTPELDSVALDTTAPLTPAPFTSFNFVIATIVTIRNDVDNVDVVNLTSEMPIRRPN